MANKILNFFFELGQLWRVIHSGLYVAGVKDPESVAEHVWRAAQIGYVLACFEGVDPEKVSSMVLFHDNGEARTLDLHRVASRYVDSKKGEVAAAMEQFDWLPEDISQKIKSLYREFEAHKTNVAQCAKDADYLEQAITAREYIVLGYKDCQDWINNIKKGYLKTKTAQKWILEIEKANPNEWWKGLKKLPPK